MLLPIIVAFAAGASSAPPEAKLTWREFEPGDPIRAAIPARVFGELSLVNGTPGAEPNSRIPYKAPPGYAYPKGVYEPAFAHLFMGPGKELVGVAGATAKGGPIDRFWVDWNSDKRFAPSEMATPSTTKDPFWPDALVFEFKTPPKGPTGPIHVKMLLLSNVFVSFLPTGCMAGKAELAGRVTDIAVVDLNFNGVYGDSIKDWIADSVYLDNKAVELPALVQLADGKFWEPKVAPDGRSASFAPDLAPTGTIAFEGAPVVSIRVESSGRRIEAKPVDGKLTLPAGPCGINGSFSMAESSGKKWTYQLFFGGKSRVEAGKTQTLQVAGPLKLGVDVDDSADNRSFSLSLTTEGGTRIMGIYDEQGNRPPAAELTIKDPEGKVVKTLAFAYG
jgi:hypothetical protein